MLILKQVFKIRETVFTEKRVSYFSSYKRTSNKQSKENQKQVISYVVTVIFV